MSESEWELRCDLAACYRLFVKYGWTDLIFTHLSARVPGEPEHYLINPYGLLFDEITASNLIKVNFAGEVVAGDFPYNEAGHAIHSAVLKARPDINVVLHSHTRAGSAVSCMADGFLPLSQQANEIMGMICYHEYDYAPDNASECERLGNDMADKWLMIMHNHGLLGAGRTVAEAFYNLYILENACKIQVDVMSAGADYRVPSESSRAAIGACGAMPDDGPAKFVNITWKAVLRSLERDGVEWKV